MPASVATGFGHSALQRALAACTLFSIVEYAYWTSVLLYAFSKGGSTLAGIALLVQLIPAAALAAPLGHLSGRLPRGLALSLSYAAEGTALVALAVLTAVDAAVPAVLASAIVATVLVSVARPLHNATLPMLALTPRSLVRANAATSTADAIGVFVGPALAGLLVAARGYALVPAACAIAMFVAAILTTRLGLPSTADSSTEDAAANWLSGVRTVLKDPPVFAMLLMAGAAYIVMGTLELLGVAFTQEVLLGGNGISGFVIGAVGIGGCLGSIAAALLANRPRLAIVIAGFFVISGLPLLVMPGMSQLIPVMVLLTISGLGIAVSNVAIRTLLQRTTEPHTLARVFAVHESLIMAGLALGAIAGPVLIAVLGPALAYVPVGAGLIIAAFACLPAIRGLDRRSMLRVEIPLLLRRIPFLAELPPPKLERLAWSTQEIHVDPGIDVIRQGDIGDAFYVVRTGQLSVRRDGVMRPHQIGPGDGFGELALLRNAPRATTVTALTPCTLLQVSRDDFLGTLTGSLDGALVARDVERSWQERAAAVVRDRRDHHDSTSHP